MGQETVKRMANESLEMGDDNYARIITAISLNSFINTTQLSNFEKWFDNLLNYSSIDDGNNNTNDNSNNNNNNNNNNNDNDNININNTNNNTNKRTVSNESYNLDSVLYTALILGKKADLRSGNVVKTPRNSNDNVSV